MRNNVSLLTLAGELRMELRRSPNVVNGVDDLPMLKHAIARNQRGLYDAWHWPHLHVIFPRKPLSAGQRYYDFPNGLNHDRVDKAVVWWSGEPYTVEPGIGFEEYAAYDSEADERNDPILRWDVRATGANFASTGFEVWPVPASNLQGLQFSGLRPLRPLVADNDVCDLDADLIILYAAWRLAPDDDRQAAISEAQARLKQSKANSQMPAERTILGRGAGRGIDRRNYRAVVRIGR